MVEADGGAGAAVIAIRMGLGSGDNTGELSDVTSEWKDLKTMNFSEEWTVDVDGTDVRCYGNAEDKALKAIWTDGKYSYSILALGQGDTWKEFGLPEDDIILLVQGTTKADANKSASEEKKSAESTAGQTTGNATGSANATPGFNVENAVWENGLGEFVSYYYDEDGDCWAVVTLGSDGEEYVTYLDNEGNVIGDNSEGEWVEDDGEEEDGPSGPNFDDAVWENGLGEYEYSYYDEDEGAWAVVTTGSDGEEYTTYMDEEGNVVD